jgi:hypothetical protein
MKPTFQARWISKRRLDEIRKSGKASRTTVLDSMKGFLIVEPEGSNLGDGDILPPEAADYEVRPEWCLNPRGKIAEARRLLGLPADTTVSSFAVV